VGITRGPIRIRIGPLVSGGCFPGIFGFRRCRHELDTACRKRAQPHDEKRTVVRSDAVGIFLPASEAAMHEHLLAISPHQDAGRFHQRVAIALAVARMAVVDMARVQTVRAVVPVASTRDRRANELLAVPALECLVGLGARWSGQARSFPKVFAVPFRTANAFVFMSREVDIVCLPIDVYRWQWRTLCAWNA
jgi:hypothetical protein